MILRDLLIHYIDLDSRLAQYEAEATQRKYMKKVSRLKSLRASTDRAYFVMMFASFESHLNQKCAQLISARKGKQRWRHRRPWDTLPTAPEALSRIPFKNRLAYCLESGSADYGLVLNHYQIRNDLAHTAGTTKVFAVPHIANDLMRIARALQAH